MADTLDVLILGGGLAGAAAATLLARAGRRVLLMEREPSPRQKVCGEFLSAEALHLLAVLGIDVATAGAQTIRTVRLASAGQHVVTAPLPFPARSLTRCRLDALALEAAAQAGAELRQSATVEALAEHGGRWRATASTGEMFSAPRVLLATGKHDLRGFPRPPGVQSDLVALKMYFRLAAPQAAELQNAVELLLHPHAYTGLEPVEGDVANLTALVRRAHLAKLGGWPGLLAELRRANPHAARRLERAAALLPKPLAISSIPYGFVRRHALGPGLFAVGDQAAVIPSFTGDGMSIALFSGLRAAQAMLEGESAEFFQAAVHRTVRGQVARATALSRALVNSPAKDVLFAAARLWPGSLRVVAALTRVPQAALRDVGSPLAISSAMERTGHHVLLP